MEDSPTNSAKKRKNSTELLNQTTQNDSHKVRKVDTNIIDGDILTKVNDLSTQETSSNTNSDDIKVMLTNFHLESLKRQDEAQKRHDEALNNMVDLI
jgi:hypothetical protein